MSDDLSDCPVPPKLHAIHAAPPLSGVTVLLVEDSRFASEAMRLLCQRSGARIRRADCLRAARRHIATYRPTVAIVDLGLPDGSGADLIAEIAALRPRVPAILGFSGLPEAEAAAIGAGADGFLAKPVETLAAFQAAVIAALPAELRPRGLRAVRDETVAPDRFALRDDLAHAADLLVAAPDETASPPGIDYIAQFVAGLGQISHDGALTDAAEALQRDRQAGRPPAADLRHLSGIVQARLAASPAV